MAASAKANAYNLIIAPTFPKRIVQPSPTAANVTGQPIKLKLGIQATHGDSWR
jgi:hypothetical protein